METVKYDTLRRRRQEAATFEIIHEKNIAIDKKHDDSRRQAGRDEKNSQKLKLKEREEETKQRHEKERIKARLEAETARLEAERLETD